MRRGVYGRIGLKVTPGEDDAGDAQDGDLDGHGCADDPEG